MNNNENLINKSLPYIMHIDLNSCFAIIEQQANRLLRGKPVGIAAYDTPRGFVLAASYEAKAQDIKLGVNVEQARSMCPGIVIMTPDPAKYREAHRLFKAVLEEYSPNVTPKSIDEFILDLSDSPALKNKKLKISTTKQARGHSERLLHNQAMTSIALEIKKKIAESLGEWVTVNIGISTNRFLAKYAAGFDKPDGMTLIDHKNLISKYENMALVDLPGINTRFRARLRSAEIYTPVDFLNADLQILKKQVFKSIVGYYWYLRLRGHEIDDYQSQRTQIGHQYALKDKTTNKFKLEKLLMKLCEKAGRRLRKNNLYATGIHLYIGFVPDSAQSEYGLHAMHGHLVQGDNEKWSETHKSYDERAPKPSTQQNGPIPSRTSGFAGAQHEAMYGLRSWHHGEKVYHRLYSTQDIYKSAKKLLHSADITNKVRILAVNIFGLEDWDPEQLSIFDTANQELGARSLDSNKLPLVNPIFRSQEANKRISDSIDEINNRYGEFVVTPALMLEMQGEILDRIAFGGVQDV